jgi:hypothetical protein
MHFAAKPLAEAKQLGFVVLRTILLKTSMGACKS